MSGTIKCALSNVVGDEAVCSDAACPYWQRGGDDLEGGCAIERLGLHRAGADVAGFLLEIRTRLEGSAAQPERKGAGRSAVGATGGGPPAARKSDGPLPMLGFAGSQRLASATVSSPVRLVNRLRNEPCAKCVIFLRAEGDRGPLRQGFDWTSVQSPCREGLSE